MPNSTVQIPPPSTNPQYISPAGGQFYINVTQTCNVSFGSAIPTSAFSQLANKQFNWSPGTQGPYGIPANANDQVSYSYALSAAEPAGPMIGHVIIVGTGVRPKKSSKKKGKKAPAKKKSAAKKAASKTAARRKPAKKAAKKATKKATRKSPKKAAKKKSAKRSRR